MSTPPGELHFFAREVCCSRSFVVISCYPTYQTAATARGHARLQQTRILSTHEMCCHAADDVQKEEVQMRLILTETGGCPTLLRPGDGKDASLSDKNAAQLWRTVAVPVPVANSEQPAGNRWR
jgi:hypothetical protein